MQFDLNSSDYYRNFAANIKDSVENSASRTRTDSGAFIEMEEGSVVESHADSRKRILESKISQEENPQRLRELQKMAAEIENKRNKEISRQEQLIRKQLNVEEDFRDSEDRVFQNRNYEGVSYDESAFTPTSNQTQITRTIKKVTNHPMYEVFKGVKKTQELDLNIVWKEMLPRWDFMQMMEESHEVSIIEYFTNLILENILEDSETLKAMINKELMIKVYGEEEYNKMLKEEETRLKKAEEERMIKEIEEKLKQEKKETIEKVLREQMEKEESLEVEESDIKLDLDIKIDEEDVK